MKKKLVTALFATLLTTSFTISAYGSDFDAAWYAAKYPEVVAQFGTTNAEVLENHYNLIGKNEGKFANGQEELAAVQAYIAATSQQEVATSNTPTIKQNNTEVKNTSLITWTDNIQPTLKVSSYVDVDIANQTVVYFEDGKSVFSVPCVTGNPKKGHATPTGTFKILTHMNGKRLKGKTWDVWVNKWMRFTSDSCGLHDASWRKNFGGNIYLTNGSHGCVNLPKDAAYELFDRVKVGTTVYVH